MTQYCKNLENETLKQMFATASGNSADSICEITKGSFGTYESSGSTPICCRIPVELENQTDCSNGETYTCPTIDDNLSEITCRVQLPDGEWKDDENCTITKDMNKRCKYSECSNVMTNVVSITKQ